MMSEFHAKADPDFGRVHRLHTRLLDNDNGLAVYIMQEMLKEEKSFYWPYLRVLPTPYNLRGWNGEHLLLLQDHKLVRRVAARRRQLRMLYDDTIEYLSNNYPELYSVSAVSSRHRSFTGACLCHSHHGRVGSCSHEYHAHQRADARLVTWATHM